MDNQRKTVHPPEGKTSKFTVAENKFLRYGGVIFGVSAACGGIYAFFQENLETDMLPFFQAPVAAFIMPVVIINLLALLAVIIFDYRSEAAKLKGEIESIKTEVTTLNGQVSGLEKYKHQAEELELQVTSLSQEKGQLLAQKKRLKRKAIPLWIC